jgi:hypothetical protein
MTVKQIVAAERRAAANDRRAAAVDGYEQRTGPDIIDAHERPAARYNRLLRMLGVAGYVTEDVARRVDAELASLGLR